MLNDRPAMNSTILSGDVDVDNSFLPDPDDSWHVVTMTGEQTRIDGFVISNGYADGGTLGIALDDSGAGVLLQGGSNPRSIVANCRFQFCVAFGRGAGLFATNTSDIRVRHCTFANNICIGDGVTTGLGGGLAFENVGTVSGSTASVAGIGSCVFARNRAARGGAISLKDLRAPAAIYDCKIHDNVAQWVGGAIHPR
jgi:predicted outer membrane repeat protein